MNYMMLSTIFNFVRGTVMVVIAW